MTKLVEEYFTKLNKVRALIKRNPEETTTEEGILLDILDELWDKMTPEEQKYVVLEIPK